MEAIGSLLLVLVVLALAMAAYFLPYIIASKRKHKNSTAIFVLNLFLGWTFLGWVVTLVWAFSAQD